MIFYYENFDELLSFWWVCKKLIKFLSILAFYLRPGLENIFWTYSSCGASGLNFSLVLTPVELGLKSGILKETKHIIQ